MKKRVVWYSFLLVVLLFIAGCGEGGADDLLPPEPGAPGALTEEASKDIAGRAHYTYEQGYASPYDVYEPEDASNPSKNLLFPIEKASIDILADTGNTFTFPVKVTHPGGYVYRYGYIYKKTGCTDIPYDWVRYDFAQGQTGGTPRPCVSPTDPNRCALISSLTNKQYLCIEGTPNPNNQLLPNTNYMQVSGTEYKDITLTLNKADFDIGENYIVTHSCKRQGGVWRCGMQVRDGAGGKWMLQKFTVLQIPPPDPNAPSAGTATLTVEKDGTSTGTGTVTSSDIAGIACGSTCNTQSAPFNVGTAVTLTAAADAGGTATWSQESGCDAGTVANACRVTMGTTAKTATVRFTAAITPATVELRITKAGTGTGTVTSGDMPQTINCGTDCTKIVNANTQVTLTATPAAGSVFEGWSGDCTGTGTCSPTMTASRSTTAKFSIDAHVVCKMLLRETATARPARLTDVTVDNAEAKCAALNVFGTGTTTAYSVTEADIKATSKAETLTTIENAGQADEKLVCALPCTAGRNTIIKCKDIASADPDGAEGDPDGRLFIFNPDPKCQ